MPNIEASSIIEESGKLYVVYPGLPDTIQTILNRFCIQYQNNRLIGNFGADKNKYQAFIQCSGQYYLFSRLISELNRNAAILQGGSNNPVKEAEVVNNFAILMSKYAALLIEKEGFGADNKLVVKSLKFDDAPGLGLPGELIGGTIECTGTTCFIGAVIDDMSYFQVGLQKASVTFVDRNQRKINFLAGNSYMVSYLTENDFNNKKVYKTIAKSTVNQVNYYKLLTQGDAKYFHVVKGTFTSNGVPKKNKAEEILTMSLGCAVPSGKYPEGFEIQQISQKVSNKDYFTLGNYPNFYCTEENPNGVSINVENPPSEQEVAMLETAIIDYLAKKITTPPTFNPRTTTIIGKTENAILIIPQTSEEAKTLIT